MPPSVVKRTSSNARPKPRPKPRSKTTATHANASALSMWRQALTSTGYKLSEVRKGNAAYNRVKAEYNRLMGRAGNKNRK